MVKRLLSRFFGRKAPSTDAAYAAIVAQARQPAFYAALGVPDTPEGRFRMVALHVILFVDALLEGGTDAAAETEERKALARAVQEKMFDELDASLREMGVSDLAVPKRMHRLADAFFAQLGALRAALAADERAALQEALARHIYAETETAEHAAALADYVQGARDALRGLPLAVMRAGRIPWPPATSESEESAS